jgi:outer membrane porin, OprD family
LHRAPAILAALAMASLLPMCGTAVRAQSVPTPESAASGGSSDDDTPDSTEQGQTQLSDSFDRRPIAAMLHDSKLVGLRDTTFNIQIRSYFLNRDNFNDTASEAWALGGSAGFKTGYFGNFISFGATGYTSDRLYGPQDKDGTKLLQTDQQPYTVVGELYAQFRLTDEIVATAGRRGFDTPFINTQDSLMTPNTFQVYSLQGAVDNSSDTTLRFGAGFVDQIKTRNSEDFQSMATAAGAPGGVDRGVYIAGANYKVGQLSVGAVEYYSADIINIAYTEIKYTFPLAARVKLVLSAQYTDQRSNGDTLLTGKPFRTDQGGAKADFSVGSVLFTVARTLTAVGTQSTPGNGTDMRNPWGGYPGYTAVQVENFYRAGENATMLRAAYNFPKSNGLSVYGLWVHGSTPVEAMQYAQNESDFNLQWNPRKGPLQRLKVVARYAHISQGGPTNQHEDELRFIIYYQLR